MASARAKTRLSCKMEIKEQQFDKPNSPVCTPTKNNSYRCDRDYSPVFLPSTQEALENVDVLWDWNSPQSKIALTRRTKRMQKSFSPKLPIKKQSSSNQIKSFDKLKEHLKAFQEETKLTPNSNIVFDESELELDKNSNELDDLFDDSIEEELLLISQQIEEKFINKPNSLQNINVKLENNKLQSPLHSKPKSSPRNLLTKSFSSNTLDSPIRESPIKRSVKKIPFNFSSKMQELKNESLKNNDSLELALESFETDDFNIINEINTSNKSNTTNSALKLKTKSLSFGDHYAEKGKSTVLNEQILKEIERKRLEALAKLNAKKKHEVLNSDSDTSPIKCSPEEIENKRLMALAKLEAKKKLDIIERNRQEALRKLEMNRKKRLSNIEHCNLR